MIKPLGSYTRMIMYRSPAQDRSTTESHPISGERTAVFPAIKEPQIKERLMVSTGGMIWFIAIGVALSLTWTVNRDSLWVSEIQLLLILTSLIAGWLLPLNQTHWVAALTILVSGQTDLQPTSTWPGLLIRWTCRSLLIGSLLWGIQFLRRRLEQAERLALTDDLTGLPNRRALLKRIADEFVKPLPKGCLFSVAILDCDRFKQVNDRQGHLAGDQLLIAMGTVFRNHLPKNDFVGRFGGDEFVLLLPGAEQDQAAQAIDSLRIALSQELHRTGTDLTFSTGVLTVIAPDPLGPTTATCVAHPLDCLHLADGAMYAAKREAPGHTHFCHAVRC